MFSERMAGRLSFTTDNPTEGASDHNAIPVILNASITIADINAFIRDPQHRGEMQAQLFSPRLGSPLQTTSTNFQLFSPTGTIGHVEMVYEVGFLLADKHYWLSGRKAIRRSYPWWLWRDTTSLAVQLYRGQDAQGLQIAAGVLRLGVIDFLRLLLTLRSRDCVSTMDGIKSIAAFAGFFIRGLWQHYGFG